MLNSPRSCASANPPQRLTRLGDIAVTPYAVNWNCKLADWTGQCAGAPDLCTYPAEVAGPKNECATAALLAELLSASLAHAHVFLHPAHQLLHSGSEHPTFQPKLLLRLPCCAEE